MNKKEHAEKRIEGWEDINKKLGSIHNLLLILVLIKDPEHEAEFKTLGLTSFIKKYEALFAPYSAL